MPSYLQHSGLEHTDRRFRNHAVRTRAIDFLNSINLYYYSNGVIFHCVNEYANSSSSSKRETDIQTFKFEIGNVSTLKY
ncbi:hypothetical protein T11_8962 [Trichinella zimbabwensis]|uniref:Uncharacterized protein n=1 Tax=Trichinella zimbabwensis TaxID=268475 RepID=A0A0V1GXQ0_9BILA|nr:hypothetical protein T11_8962 [Trichinella zimbabwensis]